MAVRRSIVVAIVGALIVALFPVSGAAEVAETSPSFGWVHGFGGAGDEYAVAMAADPSGGVVVVGRYRASDDPKFYAPATGTGLPLDELHYNAFVLKVDSAGTLEWAVSLAGPDDDQATDVAVDADGNVYVTGRFSGTVDFKPGAGTVNRSSVDDADFVWKLDSDGKYVWVFVLPARIHGIALDSNGDPRITGRFEETVDFDPGGSTHNLTAAYSSPVPRSDAFVAAYDSGGNYQWAVRAGASDDDEGSAIAVDPHGNVFVAGVFIDTVDFDPGAGVHNETPVGHSDVFVWKLDDAGHFKWVKTKGDDKFNYANAIQARPDGSVVVAATWGEPEDIWSLDAKGHTEWTNGMDTVTVNDVIGMATDATGNVYVAGKALDSANHLHPNQIEVARFDRIGNRLWSRIVGAEFDDLGRDVAIGQSGTFFVTGEFEATVDFDPDGGGETLASKSHSTDAFILKWASPTPECSGRQASIIGTDGADVLVGTTGNDVIVGLGGGDDISGRKGKDRICGGSGSDVIDGGSGKDKISGNGGDDELYGKSGNDVLKGNAGTDLLDGGTGTGDKCRSGETLIACEL